MEPLDLNLDENSVMNTNVWPRRCPARLSARRPTY